MIVLLGDLHVSIHIGIELARRARQGTDAPVVQVGDLDWRREWADKQVFPFPVHFIEGNHDHIPSLLEHAELAEVAPNLIYCPRGTILELGCRRLGFLGGARSTDRAVRVKGESWWPEEALTWEETEGLQNATVDVLITHTPPANATRKMGWAPDASSTIVESVWESLGQPRMFC